MSMGTNANDRMIAEEQEKTKREQIEANKVSDAASNEVLRDVVKAMNDSTTTLSRIFADFTKLGDQMAGAIGNRTGGQSSVGGPRL